MNGSNTTYRNSTAQQIRGIRNFMWVTMLMSLAVVFFGMQLMMVGPLKGRLDGIQARLNDTDESMGKLVATRDSVWRTNDLLTSLNEQAAEMDTLRKSIADIAVLRDRIQNEAEASSVALASVDRMAGVQNRLINEGARTQNAMTQVAALHDLRGRILESESQTEVADNTLEGMLALQDRVIAAANGYDQASASVAQLSELTNNMIAQSDSLRVAAGRFDEFVGLKDAINAESADILTAQDSALQLAALKNDVLASVGGVDEAHDAARVLVAMNDTLNGSNVRLDSASANLESLIGIQNRLHGESNQIAEAIETIEIMEEFRTEVAGHLRSMENLRRTLIELAMLETTVGRVAQVIEPLTEIGSLRRLSDTEMREAARVILDRRTTRFSDSSATLETGAVAADEADVADEDLVPIPPEARN